MTYEKVKNLNPEEFKRFCGVYPETFKATSQKPLRGKMKATTASLASQPIACGC